MARRSRRWNLPTATITCCVCGATAERPLKVYEYHHIRNNHKPYCGRDCYEVHHPRSLHYGEYNDAYDLMKELEITIVRKRIGTL